MPLSLEAFTGIKHLRVSLKPPQLSHNVITPLSRNSDSTSQTSLLDLPWEIRANILKYILKAQPFLSSRQEISAVGPGASYNLANPSPANESSLPPLPLPENGIAKKSGRVPVTGRPSKPSPFNSPSITFKQYAESRHADTAILYTCRQLRAEGLHLWYQYNYYLTVVLEVPWISTPRNPSAPAIPLERPALIYHPTDKSRLIQFWSQIGQELRWPSWEAVKKFKKFHISLYIEDRAFHSLTQPVHPPYLPPGVLPADVVMMHGQAVVDVPGQGLVQVQPEEWIDPNEEVEHTPLSSREILSILLGESSSTSTFSSSSNTKQSSSQPRSETQIENQIPEFESVVFKDHTFLGIVRDTNEDVRFTTRWHRPTRSAEEQDDGDYEAKVSFCIELWRSGGEM